MAIDAPPLANFGSSEVVLIVDDQPGNLAVLHDALDESGYTVLVATGGEQALARTVHTVPDVVLLDTVMPGLSGYDVARRLKATPSTAAVPIVFMTGLVDTEHVVQAFAAGGVDYVTKPIRPKEVLARIAAHMHNARLQRQARHALDAFGHATLVVRLADGRLVWQTALARRLLQAYFGTSGDIAPAELAQWARNQSPRHVPGTRPPALLVARGARRLTFALHEPTGDGEWLVVLREDCDDAVVEATALAFRLTSREAEVLYWVVKGKINRDIGDILGMSPATVKKHLEHVFAKLGVETRTAAAAMALSKVQQLAA